MSPRMPTPRRKRLESWQFRLHLNESPQRRRNTKSKFSILILRQPTTREPPRSGTSWRIYLECGHLDQAYDWYQRAYNTALKKPDATAHDKDLWGFRWEAGQARVAARRGEKKVAAKEVIAAKTFVDRLHDTQQQAFVPYLNGYIDFYAQNYTAAVAELKQANQKDLFVLDLLARAYEKSNQKPAAASICDDILKINAHNIGNAFARPNAKRMLEAQAAIHRSAQ